MSDAQAWTLIAGFFAIMSTMVAMTLRIVRVEISSLDTRIDAIDRRLGDKIDHLDRKVQTVINRLMGG